MPGFFIEERCPKTFEGIPKRPKVLKTSKIRDFVIKGMECQLSKNVGLGKFCPILKSRKLLWWVSFSGYSLSWRLEDFEVSVSNFVSRVSQSLESGADPGFLLGGGAPLTDS